jgi:hypothetical protein
VQQADFVQIAHRRFNFVAWQTPERAHQRPVPAQCAAADVRQHAAALDEIGVLRNKRERQTRFPQGNA